jgi:hypothetical protein
MPHPTPTPAKSASPPPRGEGMGVGAPALALLAALLLTTPTHAQIIPTGSPAADILLSQAITEHRVFLTCSALDPATHAQIAENWQRDITAAAAILAAHNVPKEAITAFTTAADPAALMPAEDTPWAEVKGLCDTHPDWQQTYFQLNLTILDLKLPGAFE